MDEYDSNPTKFEYLAAWNAIFYAVLGWSSDQVLDWVNKHYAQFLDNPDDIIYHGDPIYWAAKALIPSHLAAKLPNIERIRLEQKIAQAF